METCLICERVRLWTVGQNPYIIHEFPYSLFVVGDHQYFQGYSLLLLKAHVRELHELDSDVQTAMFQELMSATRAVVRALNPKKINHVSAGNSEPHVHWHIFPRYLSEATLHRNPFFHADQFAKHAITPEQAISIATHIREYIV
jgi:diadenosine tetraphosphate (Ap4A) HIT family hydrolase